MSFSTSDDRKAFLEEPRESLGVEMKQWIDPSSKEGKAKIAKACIALRNNNGGVFIVGLCDDGSPDTVHEPQNVRADFHSDIIQAIVSKYSSEVFGVSVSFEEYGGAIYPFIEVPSGVVTPVVCKAGISGDSRGELLKTDTVYVRTLHSSGIASSSAARGEDWARITRHCFENREADIGAFIRRHLSGLDLEKFKILIGDAGINAMEKTAIERSTNYLQRGYDQFCKEISRRELDSNLENGFIECSVVVDGNQELPDLNEELLGKLITSAPQNMGWPPWMISNRNLNESLNYFELEEGWQALLSSFGNGSRNLLEFWRIESPACFYLIRALEDDMGNDDNHPEAFTVLDFKLQIRRVAEKLSTVLSFGNTLVGTSGDASLGVSMRWRKLKGRILTCWSDSFQVVPPTGVSHQDEITTTALIPVDIPLNALAPHVEKLASPVFELFGGMKFNQSVYESIVKETVERRM